MISQGRCALYPCIGQRTDFLTVETIPFSTIEFLVKFKYKFIMDEIYESIPYIAWVVVVDGQVEKIKSDRIMPQLLQQEFLSIFVGNISDH